jgi:cell division protein FtsB
MRDPDFQEDLMIHPPSGTARSRNSEPKNIWQKMSRVLEVVIYILLMLGFAKLMAPDLRRQKDLENDLVKFEKVRKEKEAEVARLRIEHGNLTSDQQYLEAVARDRLNLQLEGEYLIQISR